MDELTLHDLVTKTLDNGDTYVAIDSDNTACSYSQPPRIDSTGQYWLPGPGGGGYRHIGYYKPTCHWMETIMDATIITLRGDAQ